MLLSTLTPDFDVKGPVTLEDLPKSLFKKTSHEDRQILIKQTTLLILQLLSNGSFSCGMVLILYA